MAKTHANEARGQQTRTRIYAAIVMLYGRDGRPPSLREICAASGICVGSLLRHLPRLEAAGCIHRAAGPRGIIPVHREEVGV